MASGDLILNLKKQIALLEKENALVRSNNSELEDYELIISATSDLMSFIDTNYTYRSVNNASSIAHGKSKEEIIGNQLVYNAYTAAIGDLEGFSGHGEQANIRVRRYGGRNIKPYASAE